MLALQYDRATDQQHGDQIPNSPLVDMANPNDMRSTFSSSESQSRPNVVDSGQLVFDNPYVHSDGKIIIGPGMEASADRATEPLSAKMLSKEEGGADSGSTDSKTVRPLCDTTTTGTGSDGGGTAGQGSGGGTSVDQQILTQLQQVGQDVQQLSTDVNQLMAGSGSASSGSGDSTAGGGQSSGSGASSAGYNPANDAALQNLSNTGDSQLQQTLLNAWSDVQNGTLSQSAYSQFENAAIPLTTPANDPAGVPFNTDSTLEQAALSSIQPNLSTSDVATLQGLINPQSASSGTTGSSGDGSTSGSSGSGTSDSGTTGSSSTSSGSDSTYNPANDAALQNLSNTGDSQLQQMLLNAWSDVQNGTLSQSAYSQFENAAIPLTTPANDPAGVPFNTDSTLEQAALSSVEPNLSTSDVATLQGLINPQTASSGTTGGGSDAGASSGSGSDGGASSSSGSDAGCSNSQGTSAGSSFDQQILAQLQQMEQEIQVLTTDLTQLLGGSSDGSTGTGSGSSGNPVPGTTYNPADDAALQNLSNTGDSQLQQMLLSAWADVQNGTLSQSAYSQFENAAIPLTTPANDPAGVPFLTDSTLEQAALSSVQPNLSTTDVATLQGLINPSQTSQAA